MKLGCSLIWRAVTNKYWLLEEKIQYKFKNVDWLLQALTHPSSRNRNASTQSYERLEFLGDRVINLVMASELYKIHPRATAGDLATMHAKLVNRDAIATVAISIDLGDFLFIHFGEERNGGRRNKKNLEDAMEALIGAVYSDCSYGAAEEVAKRLWTILLQEHSTANLNNLVVRDCKSRLQEIAHTLYGVIPKYNLIATEGLAHAPIFTVEVIIAEKFKATATGHSKKSAEQSAAQELLKTCGSISND